MFADKTLTIGDNKIYGNATNCALKPAESYAIMIALMEEESMNDRIVIVEITSIRVGKVSKRYDEIWIVPITIFLIVAALVFYFYQRCKQIFLPILYTIPNEMDNLIPAIVFVVESKEDLWKRSRCKIWFILKQNRYHRVLNNS